MSDREIVDSRRRVVVENVSPTLDGGRFPVKRVLGDAVSVAADVVADGHDELAAVLLVRAPGQPAWREIAPAPVGNDRYEGSFTLDALGRWEFAVRGWIDRFATWLHDLEKRLAAAQDVRVDLAIGAALVEAATRRAAEDDVPHLAAWHRVLTEDPAAAKKLDRVGREDLAELMARAPDRTWSTRSPTFAIQVERRLAEFGAWYELFPRSCATLPGKHGNFDDVIARLPYVAELGFDVLYLPPIHPIGQAFRKGPNNGPTAAAGDPGSPWGIGSGDGGHTAVHPQLGTLADFRRLQGAARGHGLEVALDVAFQCSPDHPYVRQHPEWFRHRPDGTIQYAENPPKKYQDIYPFDFETPAWQALWAELIDVVAFWCEEGVRIFRVDNPHTKPFAFWERLIGEIQGRWPDAIFLSEAFTRPKVMYRLAKLGFSQSYTYFTWRNTKAEFIEYFSELAQPAIQDFFRPNLWPNTPDILPPHLQTGERAAFVVRLALAATLSASYGIYGPAFELLEHEPREPLSEEYLHSEKYEIRRWPLDAPRSLRTIVARVNRARRENPALHANRHLHFHATDNDHLLAFSKRCPATGNVVLVVANLDWYNEQHGFVELALGELALAADRPFALIDLLSDLRCAWSGARNFVQLDPRVSPVHVFLVQGA